MYSPLVLLAAANVHSLPLLTTLAAGFTEACLALVENRGVAREEASRAAAIAKSEYEWNAIGGAFRTRIEQLLSVRKERAA